ncbi:hypothetical protein [Luteibacter sp. CQ10]|uniref:hypothetical protein n=1 Tax=Luteibacter sp. CQ10 TaxID=2805821 RepID=UPI0034A2FF13
MKRSRVLFVAALSVIGIAVIWVFVIPRAVLSIACDRAADRKAIDEAADFYCPAGNDVSYQAWGECGLMKVCIDPRTKEKNGAFFASQGGRLRVKSLYSSGVDSGGLTTFDNSGKAKEINGGYRISKHSQPLQN